MYCVIFFLSTSRTLQKLPSELLGALDLNYLLNQTQNPQQLAVPSVVIETQTTTQTLQENILSFQQVYSNSGMSPERIIAKALVDYILYLALRRVVTSTFTFGSNVRNDTAPSSCGKQAFLTVNSGADAMMEWRETRRFSSGSIRGLKEGPRGSISGISMDSEGYTSATSDCSDFPKAEKHKVSFRIGDERTSMSMDILEEVDEEELRVVAKKLVMKILHMACKEVESLNRRSSIEYLIASTKRMRIEESPSPPPILFNIAEEQDGVDASDGKAVNPFSELKPSQPPSRFQPSERSPTPEHLLLRRLGKKRGRSGSHEVSALREFIETSRRSRLVRKLVNFKEKLIGGFQPPNVKSPTKSNDDSSSQSGDESMSFTSLITNMNRMTIHPQQESDTESETTSNADESFTVLSAVTVSEDPLAGLRDEAGSTGDSRTFPFREPPMSDHQRSNHLGATDLLSTTSTNNSAPPNSLALQFGCASAVPNDTGSSFQDPVISNMDLFVIIHSRPTLGKCQKFLCNNTNEINLMYHCWMYPDALFDPSVSMSGRLEMGVFEPYLVDPVHQDLQDAGVAFYFLDERYVRCACTRL